MTRLSAIRYGIIGWLLCLLASCVSPSRPAGAPGAEVASSQPPSIPVAWQSVENWDSDMLFGASAALRANCSKLARQSNWAAVCAAANQLDGLDPLAARAFFEHYFIPYRLTRHDGSTQGLITGYYEPQLRGSRQRHPPYLYPLYRWPASQARGTVLPQRRQLRQSALLAGSELVYVDDPLEAFFLQVQGSGRIVLDDGTIMRVGVSGTNGQPYRSIGQWLIDQHQLPPGQASMQSIKNWARLHPQQIDTLLDVNPRFVFFKEIPADNRFAANSMRGPIGAFGVPLTPQRSIAVDPAFIPLGSAVFLSTTWPNTTQPLARLVFAQDIGSAVKGRVRADLFWGFGDAAGELAGKTKQAGQMWLLLPRPDVAH